MTPYENANQPADSGWISSSTVRSLILVLCGYLVGITAAHVCTPAMEACALAAAAIGLIAHGLFVYESRRRHAAETRLAIQKASVRLERRVEMHVSIPRARLHRAMHTNRPRMHEQYLSVVRSARATKHAYNAGR
jgi:C4-dicarboxylate-specific signal transduction histidine kinase